MRPLHTLLVFLWDGRGDSGERLAAGVYLYTLDGADRRLVRPVTLLR